MKRILFACAVLLLCLTVACAAKPETEQAEPKTVTAPGEIDLTLTLPLGARDGVAKALPGYTAGFSAQNSEALRLSAVSGDPSVADCALKDDGTLYVIARGAGETKLSVTAATDSGEQATATVSVTVRDGRRMLALILLGTLGVTLLALLGKPSGEPAKQTEPEPAEPEETSDPVVIFEEPKDDPERRQK